MTRYEKDDLDIFEVRKDSKCFDIVKNNIADGIHAFPVIVQFPTSKMYTEKQIGIIDSGASNTMNSSRMRLHLPMLFKKAFLL